MSNLQKLTKFCITKTFHPVIYFLAVAITADDTGNDTKYWSQSYQQAHAGQLKLTALLVSTQDDYLGVVFLPFKVILMGNEITMSYGKCIQRRIWSACASVKSFTTVAGHMGPIVSIKPLLKAQIRLHRRTDWKKPYLDTVFLVMAWCPIYNWTKANSKKSHGNMWPPDLPNFHWLLDDLILDRNL